ncbi:MAG: tripartite tricarboxylate transporter TctB family protein [Desulfovibrio sp.]|jgi:hypothetical protein|nr:tripartite tricarboxylate transporter TctB family protein [Desulfovibrio sp.]
MRFSGEWIVVIIMFIVCAFFYALISAADPRSTQFPLLMLVLMLSIGALKIIAQILEKKQLTNGGERYPFFRVSFIIAAIALYIVAMDYIGFYTASFVFFLASTLALQNVPHTPRVIAMRAGLGLTLCASLYLLFTVLLKVQIPKGIFM